MNSLPKVLFVTPCAFNHQTGSGITYSNLFRGWPKDRLATVHRDGIPVSADVCSQYYRLRWNELTPTLPYSSGVLNRGFLSGSLSRWIEAFAPEVLYTVLGTVGYMDLVRAIQKRFHIPVVAHLMDEGVTDPQVKGWCAPWIKAIYGRLNRSILSEASACLGICDSMSAAYAERFGVPFQTFMNTIDMDRFPSRAQVSAGEVLRLVYSGSILSFAQAESLRDIAQAVRHLYQQRIKIRLDIFTPIGLAGQSIHGLEQEGCVFLHAAIEDDAQYFRTLQEADILVLPVNFDSRSIHFIRYSMPTKVPAYLCSGTPVLVYGPPNVAQVDYAEKNQWGYVVNRRDATLLNDAILRLRDDHSLRETLSRAAVATARAHHNSATVRTQFQEVLAKAAHG